MKQGAAEYAKLDPSDVAALEDFGRRAWTFVSEQAAIGMRATVISSLRVGPVNELTGLLVGHTSAAAGAPVRRQSALVSAVRATIGEGTLEDIVQQEGGRSACVREAGTRTTLGRHGLTHSNAAAHAGSQRHKVSADEQAGPERHVWHAGARKPASAGTEQDAKSHLTVSVGISWDFPPFCSTLTWSLHPQE
jgi:hypothetical protein